MASVLRAASYNREQVRSACTTRGAVHMDHKVSCNVFRRQLARSINISTSRGHPHTVLQIVKTLLVADMTAVHVVF